jgi:ubiquinol oxidase
VDTYEEFVDENEELLKSLPPPLVALEYYKAGDLYLFDELQTTGTDPKRRPSCKCVCPNRQSCTSAVHLRS